MRIYTAVAVLLAGLILGFSSAWQVQAWRLGLRAQSVAAAQAAAEALAMKRAAAREHKLQQEKDHALTQAITRAQANRLAADAAGSELNRLRHEIAASGAERSVHPACTPAADRASAAAELFSACAGALVDLARHADGHANDARTLIEAWPSAGEDLEPTGLAH